MDWMLLQWLYTHASSIWFFSQSEPYPYRKPSSSLPRSPGYRMNIHSSVSLWPSNTQKQWFCSVSRRVLPSPVSAWRKTIARCLLDISLRIALHAARTKKVKQLAIYTYILSTIHATWMLVIYVSHVILHAFIYGKWAGKVKELMQYLGGATALSRRVEWRGWRDAALAYYLQACWLNRRKPTPLLLERNDNQVGVPPLSCILVFFFFFSLCSYISSSCALLVWVHCYIYRI